ncbi:MAG: RHS repeat-associated core domain-containing protein, partial [Alcanivorax sp.]|nr:RHS repeat-associated core domain-containing protein [Alcanivorax sp.]
HTTSNTYYAIKDHQNTVIALTDSNGSVVESYEYDAYGTTRIFDASGTELTTSAYGNRYLFQGREYDSTTGLYYFRARWYNPETGRWLSKDPIRIKGGLNQYEFCANNPVNCVDPMGLYSWHEFWDDTADVLAVVSLAAGVVAVVASAPAVVAVATGVAISAGIHSIVADSLAEGLEEPDVP